MSGALVKPCTVATAPKNTGVECSVAMGAPAVIVMMPNNAVWDESDEADFYTYLLEKLHAPLGQRWYLLFGKYAPIRTVTNAKENDSIETLDDGSQHLIRKGMITRTFMTTEGGECLAKALDSFPTNYAFIEIDGDSNIKRMINGDGTRSGFPTNLAYSPVPDFADFKTSYKNAWLMNFSPRYYVSKGSIAASDDTDFTELNGLLDAELFVGDAGISTTTKLKFKVQTECAETDLVALLGNALAQVSNFVVTKVSDGTAVVISAAAIVGGHVELTGTFVSGTHYSVALADAATLLSNGVQGFEGANSLDLSF